MALTRLPKNAFATGSVDTSKIEDGTIQAVEISGTITQDKIATGTIVNAKLSNTSITINGTSVALGASASVGVDVNWQSVITADGSTATTGVAGNGYFIDTTSNAHTFNLPASATLGDQIAIKDYAGTFNTNNLTIGRNGHNIQGVANNSLITTNRASLLLVYVDSTKGWLYAEESNVADLQGPSFLMATGGTITTTGDYKIHTFTGDGCFAISSLANPLPASGPNVVDYLVVAGGGGGGYYGGAGGGAGGARMSSGAASGCYTASPLGSGVSGITVSATTYPITVGGGGFGRSGFPYAPGCNGSPSSFSTITSTGGGGGGGGQGFEPISGKPGGSGGGGGGGSPCYPAASRVGGNGNTPPTNPSQGFGGGTGVTAGSLSGGGGGATGAGQPAPTGSNGGVGVGTAINPSPSVGTPGPSGSLRYFAGGGSGSCTPGATNGTVGGGGNGSNPTYGGAGVTNTGGGGAEPGSGGSGIVIIRYKFQ